MVDSKNKSKNAPVRRTARATAAPAKASSSSSRGQSSTQAASASKSRSTSSKATEEPKTQSSASTASVKRGRKRLAAPSPGRRKVAEKASGSPAVKKARGRAAAKPASPAVKKPARRESSPMKKPTAPALAKRAASPAKGRGATAEPARKRARKQPSSSKAVVSKARPSRPRKRAAAAGTAGGSDADDSSEVKHSDDLSQVKDADEESSQVEEAEQSRTGLKKKVVGSRAVKNMTGPAPASAKWIRVSHTSHPEGVRGAPVAVGQGDVGQLGLGSEVMERSRFARVTALAEASCSQVVAGGMHSVCLAVRDGDVWTFGCNDEGALGRSLEQAKGDDDDEEEEDLEMVPRPVGLGHRAVLVSAGDSHTAALTAEGRVFMWGTFRDINGSIGLLVERQAERTPVELTLPSGVDGVVKVASGNDHLLLLSTEGQVYSMGCGDQGQLGRVAMRSASRGGRRGVAHLLSPLPALFPKGGRQRARLRLSDIWAGTFVSFAKEEASGRIFAWGLNNYYQLGVGDMVDRFKPEEATGWSPSLDWTMFAPGEHHTIAVNKEGTVYAVGRGTYGQLGRGRDKTDDIQSPQVIEGALAGHHVVAVAACASVSFARTESGSLYAWGMGSNRQLGQGGEDDEHEPTLVRGRQLEGKMVVGLGAGAQHTLALVKPVATAERTEDSVTLTTATDGEAAGSTSVSVLPSSSVEAATGSGGTSTGDGAGSLTTSAAQPTTAPPDATTTVPDNLTTGPGISTTLAGTGEALASASSTSATEAPSVLSHDGDGTEASEALPSDGTASSKQQTNDSGEVTPASASSTEARKTTASQKTTSEDLTDASLSQVIETNSENASTNPTATSESVGVATEDSSTLTNAAPATGESATSISELST